MVPTGNTVLDLGTEYMPLPVADLWLGTGYPTAQVIAPWIIRHGGGRGSARDQDVVKGSWIVNIGRGLRRPAVWKRLALVLPVLALAAMWLGALFGHDSPRFGSGWGFALGGLLVGVENAGKEPTVTTDWTALDVG